LYGGIKASIGLASVMPTFYKAFEGLLLGDKETSGTRMATAAENYMAKFTAKSKSDQGSSSF
jgi:hypothetical protein